jgi:AcrR family transcriptional regulator
MRSAPPKTKRGRGRPRGFDRDAALSRAMELFWERGYDETSLDDLTRAMRINPSSLYATFGDKEQLYRAALSRYLESRRKYVWHVLDDPVPTRRALRKVLEAAAGEITRPGQPAGCMLSLAIMHGCPQTADLRASISKLREKSRAAVQARIEKGKASGDMPRRADSPALARYFLSVLQGMSVQARDGASRRELLAIARVAMRAFEP